MARDLSARPHEILNLKIKDVIFKSAGNKQYAEVLVNGKTGSRHIPLIQSIPYIKEWLSNHPSRNNPKSPLFIGMSRHSLGKELTPIGIYMIYKNYKETSSLNYWQILLCQMKIKKRSESYLQNHLIPISEGIQHLLKNQPN